MVPIEKIQELLLQIWFYTTNDADIAQQLTQILVNGEVNTNELRNLEELLIEKQMREVLQLLRETMRGKMRRSYYLDVAHDERFGGRVKDNL